MRFILSFSFLIMVLLFLTLSCKKEHKEIIIEKNNEEEVINIYLKNGAWKYHYLTKEWDKWIDKGLQKDSTIAYLWQQKAMPFWKQKKYSQAIHFYNKAVQYDRQKWLSRLGFLKCVFAKDYNAALVDLLAYKKEFGSTYEQDHSLDYRALSFAIEPVQKSTGCI